MVHNLLGIKIAPDFQRVTLARYMADTNQPENAKFCTNWVQKFKVKKIKCSFWNKREKERVNIEASDLAAIARRVGCRLPIRLHCVECKLDSMRAKYAK